MPVALLNYEISSAKDAAGEFFRSVNKQMFINQGVHVASPEGKALASSMPGRSQDGKEVITDESKRETWVNEVQAALQRGLKRFGDVKPRQVEAGDSLPCDAIGVQPDGGVSLGSYMRIMQKGLDPSYFGGPTIDNATLTAKEWQSLAPAKAAAGSDWTVPEAVARKLNPVLGCSCNDSLPRPEEVTAVRFTGKVESVANGIAYLTYEGHIAGSHTSSAKLMYRSEAKLLAGAGAYDVKAGKMLSLTMVFECKRHDGKYSLPSDPQNFGAVLEWRRERADR